MTIERESSAAARANASRTGLRPYRAPQLKYLGSVRALTLGKTSGAIFDTLKTTKLK